MRVLIKSQPGLLLMFLIFLRVFSLAANPVTIENSRIKLVTDGKHIISLYDKERNLEHIASDYTSANGIFGVGYVNATTLASVGTINASSITDATLLSHSANEVRYELENANIKVLYEVKLEESPAGLVWNISLELKNTSFTVSLVDFPRLRTPHSYGGKYKQFVEPTAEGLWRSMQTSIAWLRNYPGKLTLQMGTYISTAGGFMMWTDDTTGHVKSFGYQTSGTGSNCAVRHLMAYDSQTWESSYNTRISLHGNKWQDAADIYRNWASTQAWSHTKLRDRTDVPALLHNPPLVIASTLAVENINTLPSKLKAWGDKFGAPVIYRPQAWEKYGKWVGIDYFPVVIGDQNYINLNNTLKDNGITTSGFIEGYHWTTRVSNGTTAQNTALNEFYIANNGPALVKTNLSGAPYTTTVEVRNTQFLCRGTNFGKTFLQGIASGLMDRGVSHVHNDFDHTVDMGGPCFNPDHGHPVPYGKWETDIMTQVVSDIIQDGKTREIPNFFISRENGFELHNMMNSGYQERNFHIVSERKGLVPLYTYIYHEYIPVIFGLASANRPRNVELCALIVYGQIPSLSFWTTAASEPASNVINDATSAVLKDYYDVMKTHGKDYLLYGRMLPPIVESGNGVIHNTWDDGNGNQAVFAVDTLDINTTMSIRVPGTSSKFVSVFNGSTLVSASAHPGGSLINLDVPKWRLFSVVFTEYPLSIENAGQEETVIKVFPNPVSDILYLQLPNNSANAEVKLFDMGGRMLLNRKSAPELNLAHLDEGLYLLTVKINSSISIHKVCKH